MGDTRTLSRLSRPRVLAAASFVLVGLILLNYLFPLRKSLFRPSSTAWVHFHNNPVLPDQAHSKDTGTVFDLSILYDEGMWKMYASWRPKSAISYSTSEDGFAWKQDLEISLAGNQASQWDPVVNRPFVLKRADGEYLMWYTGQIWGNAMGGKLGLASSRDGIRFSRTHDTGPVMNATLPWERYDAVMTPCVIELPNDVLRMYYSAGESYEPDAIGVAHSYDGGHTWVKHGNPIFYPDPTSTHDNYKVTSPHVIFHEGWYYLFYCGFRGIPIRVSVTVDVDHATVNLARSRDGISNWEKSTANPVVAPEPAEGSWNCDAVYKPFVAYDEKNQQWLLWYNGRCGGLERIGVSSLQGKNFGSFEQRAGPATSLWYN